MSNIKSLLIFSLILITSCSKMIINGVQSKCSCENYEYSLATGQLLSNSEKNSYPMKLYFSEKNGNSVRISNWITKLNYQIILKFIV